ncbi:transketolase family protein [Ligilactobacillus agilis]|uniref:transketolase family protein n=1 Tax=Ligilactobacillus agilis TaxID=1601 RepID=UPI00191F5069|nr:transketolase C-terminal domain-containing protein [Ligilactobacillus agilis]MBL1054997.1 transketolase family protein [Ligilactobacillus agilis]
MTNNEALTANKAICDLLIEVAPKMPELLTVTSDSRGSAGLVPFTTAFPEHSVEMGIAEQNAVTVAAGLAHAGKRPFVFSPAAFLAMRSIEQVKVDVAYSKNNVKLIGISGGNSYSDLGNTHHSLNDVAITRAIPDLEVYQPCDKYQIRALFKYLLKSDTPAYIRIGKRKLDNVYNEEYKFIPGNAKILRQAKDTKVALISVGETLYNTIKAAELLAEQDIDATVVDLVSIKPMDVTMITELAQKYDYLVTVEEHSVINGIGAAVAQIAAEVGHARVKILGFPDQPAIAGKQNEVFSYYGLDSTSISATVKKFIQ